MLIKNNRDYTRCVQIQAQSCQYAVINGVKVKKEDLTGRTQQPNQNKAVGFSSRPSDNASSRSIHGSTYYPTSRNMKGLGVVGQGSPHRETLPMSTVRGEAGALGDQEQIDDNQPIQAHALQVLLNKEGIKIDGEDTSAAKDLSPISVVGKNNGNIVADPNLKTDMIQEV